MPRIAQTIKSALLALGLAGTSTFAAAEVHTIEIWRYGYYPTKLYVQPGDQVVFRNRSGYWAYVNNTWGNGIIGWTSNGSTRTITVNSGINLSAPNLYNTTNYGAYNGYITIGTAPRQ